MTLIDRKLLVAILVCIPFLVGGFITYVEGSATPGPELWVEDCNGTIVHDEYPTSYWTQVGQGSSAWWWDEADDSCRSNVQSGGNYIQMTAGDNFDANDFCSMQVTQMHASAARIGCLFRSTGTTTSNPGAHYRILFDNIDQEANLSIRENDFGQIDAIDFQAQCTTNSYTDIHDGDYIGITMEGAATDTQIVKMWDFGTVEYCVDENGSGGPPQDTGDADGKCDIDGATLIENAFKTPSTWDTATYECSAAEFDTAIASGDITAPGRCGPAARSTGTSSDTEPNIDNFACGDFTP